MSSLPKRRSTTAQGELIQQIGRKVRFPEDMVESWSADAKSNQKLRQSREGKISGGRGI